MTKNSAISTILALTIASVVTWLSLPDQQEIRYDQDSVSTFADIDEGGGSALKVLRDSGIVTYEVSLNSGIQYPYAGLTIPLNLSKSDSSSSQPSQEKECQDWSRISHIRYEIIAKNAGTLALDFKNWEEGRTVIGDELSYRILRKEVEVQPGKNILSFPIDHFTIPDWVRKHQKLKNEDEAKYLHQACLLDIAHGDMENPKNRIEVVSIHAHFRYFYEKIAIILSWLMLAGLVGFVKYRSDIKRAKEEQLDDNRQKAKAEIRNIETPDEWPPLVDWMKKNFDDSELNLEKVAKGVGLSTAKLSALIKSQTGLSFKAFLNELRMERACQLLKETDEQVLQIALSCGYNTVAHFNRLFKDKFEQTPTQWRKSSS